MKKNNKITGNWGEDLAAQFLEEHGYKIVERNWHYSKEGEIDIIALDKDTLVFVEVKTRKGLKFGHPLEAITEKKYNKIRSVAMAYMSQTSEKYKSCRIDAISIVLTNPPEINHLKNVFL